MNVLEIIRVSLKSLARYKLRSFLTILGIIIGTGAIIAMMAVGDGAKKDLEEHFKSIGSNLIFVRSGDRVTKGVRGGANSAQTLKISDFKAILKYCPSVKYASPRMWKGGRIVYKNKNEEIDISGLDSQGMEVFSLKVDKGTFFSPADVSRSNKVCVINNETYKLIFSPGEDPVGKTVRLDKVPFKIQGILEEKEFDSPTVIIPYTTMMQRFYRQNYLHVIGVSAASTKDIPKAMDEITALLRQRHHIAADEQDDFELGSLDEILEQINSRMQVFRIFLSSIAFISMLVGGIGIMNIMLASVTERIREIGIRMAVGARAHDILFQFITEALVLCLIGGGIGIGAGYILSSTVEKLLGKWELVVTPFAIIIALSFSMFIGLLFGFYPAWKASRLNPTEALYKR